MRKMIDFAEATAVRLYSLDGKCNISGERIREARIRAGLSQEELAIRMQLSGLQMGADGREPDREWKAAGAGLRAAAAGAGAGRHNGLAAVRKIKILP